MSDCDCPEDGHYRSCNQLRPKGFGGERAHARTGDPWTSHEAAQSISDEALRDTQQAVLECLKRRGPLMDTELAAIYKDTQRVYPKDIPYQSESGLRTRRSELVAKGLVYAIGNGVLPSGRKSLKWAAR